MELERLAREMDEEGIRWNRCPELRPEPAEGPVEGLREIVPEYELADGR